jgi:isopenicillin N synthase-like dioxygenase
MGGTGAVPVIDLGPFLTGSASERVGVATQAGAACESIGFFYVRNHGVPPELVQRAFAVARDFFALPVEAKREMAIDRSPCHRGWFAVGGENLDPARQREAGDLKEGIKIGQDLPPNHALVKAGIPLHGPNQWPGEPPELVPTMRELFGLLTSLSRELMHLFALALGLDERHFDGWLRVPMATLGPLHYPPANGQGNEPSGERLGAGAHTDFGCLTVLAQDDVGGLQVMARDGPWLDAPPIEDTFVVNVGDMLARWTNDRFASTVHRVLPAPGIDRYSMPFFFDPDFDAPVACLSTCTSPDNPPRYAPTTGLAHLLERIDETFEYRHDPAGTEQEDLQ